MAASRWRTFTFPTPGPRRGITSGGLIQEPFLRLLHGETRSPEGTVRIATDHADYFAWMREHIAKVPAMFEVHPWDQPDGSDIAG